MLAVPNRLEKVNGWSCTSRLWHLVDSAVTVYPIHVPVVLNSGSEGRIWFPATLCVALNSLSIKRVVAYFVWQTSFCCKTKRVSWIVLKIFSEVLQQNRWSGFGSLQRNGWEPLMLTMKRSDDSTHPCRTPIWGAVHKNIISDRISTKTAISAQR